MNTSPKDTKQEPSTRDELKYHPFEPTTDKFDLKLGQKFLRRYFKARIARGETTEYVQARRVLPIHEIFFEEPDS